VFGVQSGRPGWFSALQAPGFVVLAAISGVGTLLIIAGALYRRDGEGAVGKIEREAFPLLSNALWMLLLVCLYFIAVEELTARYAALEVQTDVANAMATGVYAPVFWSSLGALLLAFVLVFAQFLLRRYSVPVLALAGLLANVGAILWRFLIDVPSQTHGNLLPYPVATTRPPGWRSP
jgi:molybdopterin-containing oxidoreductase family membrane subunit